MDKNEINFLIGRCRCADHAKNYKPRPHNQSRKFYFIPPDYVDENLLCGACAEIGRGEVHGGIVLSEESRRTGIVLFEAFAGLHLNEEQLFHTIQIWPK